MRYGTVHTHEGNPYVTDATMTLEEAIERMCELLDEGVTVVSVFVETD